MKELISKSRKNLEGKKSVFFSSGVLIALSLALLAFEWGKSGYSITLPENLGINIPIFEEEIANTKREPLQTKAVPAFKFIIVPDDEEPDLLPDLPDPEPRIGDPIPIWTPPALPEEPEEKDPVTLADLNTEDWPSFPGGDEALAMFMMSNLKYPRIALETGIHGTVWVGFTVKKDGTISDIHVRKDIGGGCGDEAMRVASLMPKWKPGMQRMRPVPVKMVMPVTFRLALQ